MKRWPSASLTGTTKVVGLADKPYVLYPIALTPMLIGCNQETIAQEEGEVSSMAPTSNRPTSIATLNDTSENMNPHQRVHPMCQADVTFYLIDT